MKSCKQTVKMNKLSRVCRRTVCWLSSNERSSNNHAWEILRMLLIRVTKQHSNDKIRHCCWVFEFLSTKHVVIVVVFMLQWLL